MRRVIVAALVMLVGLGVSPAWAYYGGDDNIEQPVEAHMVIDVHPLHAGIWIDQTWLGTARDVVNLDLVRFRGMHVVTIAAPGFNTRKVDFDATTIGVRRLIVDLVPKPGY